LRALTHIQVVIASKAETGPRVHALYAQQMQDDITLNFLTVPYIKPL